MSSEQSIGEAWRANHAYLVDMAYRMLGDVGAAEDAVQEAFFRLLREPPGRVDDERGWLIVVTGRLCLDQIKSAPWRRERPDDVAVRGYREKRSESGDPADRVTLDDEVRTALLVVLDRLSPAERVAFVLHDIFQLPFDVIADTVGRPSAACRQLASRARRKVRESRTGGAQGVSPADIADIGVVTRRFISACANGDLDELLAVLDPDVSGEVDSRPGLIVLGAKRVARNLLRFWALPEVVMVSHPGVSEPTILAFVERRLVGVLALTTVGERITKIHIYVGQATLQPVRAQLLGGG